MAPGTDGSAVDVGSLELRWRLANRVFELNGYAGPVDGPEYVVEDRGSRVVVTAVHGVRHRRGPGRVKANDANTGGLVLALGEALGVSTAAILRATDGDDANSLLQHPLKSDLAPLVGPGSVLLDVHGMADRADVDIAIGLGPRESLGKRVADLAVESFRVRGYVVDADGSITGLTAAGETTMTAWAQRRGAQAIQIEVARQHRSFRGPPLLRRQLLQALLEVVTGIAVLGDRR